ncbi:hypothetical protein KUM39_07065 [Streptomyces sp. J2-1]|uniref:hypothetical protein n=1 Tax=Streptomyces corallincola TaxID=2851888 RepID=UPI001C380EF8|nr:hypothetical protein [Streptomyces corallincola]MBV2354125.1 hypothetical protein [Streptomyces corallincola]
MPMRRSRTAAPDMRSLDVEQAEAVLVSHYPRLVRLAFVTLPHTLGRHRRVLTAHRLVQSALPRGGNVLSRPRASGASAGPSPEYAVLRTRVLRNALAVDHRGRTRLLALGLGARIRRPGLPAVWGLRVFPQPGGSEEFALDRTLARCAGPVRAAFALAALDELPHRDVVRVLRDAGVREPREAAGAAGELLRHHTPPPAPDPATDPDADPAADPDAPAAAEVPHPRTPGAVLHAAEFDPCVLNVRPTDLLRRRHRLRVLALALVLAGSGVATAVALPLTGHDRTAPAIAHGGTGAPAPSPARLLRTPSGTWADTSRVDFTAWPARGGRKDDAALLGRALRTWADPALPAARTTEAGAARTGGSGEPRLLFADDISGRAVVVLYDGHDLVRYSEPLRGGGRPILVAADADQADVTTAAAVVVARRGDTARLLLAPWIAEAGLRDLTAPDRPTRPLGIAPTGLTGPVPVPSASGSCGGWPVVQLRSSTRIVENHAFLLTDLGALLPTHLTYMPPPVGAERPRPPREATGGPALEAWARTACRLNELRGKGVRAVNHWVFAVQDLPERAGAADWVCLRADTWQGRGSVEYQFRTPGGRGTTVTGRADDTAECSRFGQDVVADTVWRAPSGARYLLAAGSRSVVRIDAGTPVGATAAGRFLALRASGDQRPVVTAKLTDGTVRARR